MMPWYCAQREHEHSTEHEAAWCTELYERWLDAMGHLMDILREAEVEQQVKLALAESFGDDMEIEE
jgi:hypothetical protein